MNIFERLKYWRRYWRNKSRKVFVKPPAMVESVVSPEERDAYLSTTLPDGLTYGSGKASVAEDR
ncbi:MAG: hypothetical protein R3C40_10625 [Parvularculaceae bacterium]